MLRTSTLCLAVLLASGIVAACADDPTRPSDPIEPVDPDPPADSFVTHGVMDITFSGIDGQGSPGLSATAALAVAAYDPIGDSDGTIQLEAVSTGSFTEGVRGEGGTRYLYATFRVRNADQDGTAYTTPRTNLTFLGYGSGIGQTAIASMRLFDGSAADPSIALDIVPTGAVLQDEAHEMRPRHLDVLQVLTEAEVASIAHPGVDSIMPWGFVVRNPNDPHDRTLPADPAANDWGGVVTFAFRVPLQATPADDPFTISARVLAVDDPVTRVTQSPEEQGDGDAWTALEGLASGLGAANLNVLAGSTGSGPTVERICEIRTAGTAGSPTRRLHEVSGPLYRVQVVRPGETPDACAGEWTVGEPANIGLGLPASLTLRAMDRYGNILPVDDEVVLSTDEGNAVLPASTTLTGGESTVEAAFTAYGLWTLNLSTARRASQSQIAITGVPRAWLGGTSSDWGTADNWDFGVLPATRDTVTVAAAADHAPVLTAPVAVGALVVENGASLDIGSHDLTASASVRTFGTGAISGSSGVVVLAGTNSHVQGTLPRVRVTGRYTLSGNLTHRAPMVVQLGSATSTSHRLQVVSY